MVKSVRMKLKGGIILPEKLNKAEIEEIKQRTRDAIVSGFKEQRIDRALADPEGDIEKILSELGDDDSKSTKLEKAIFVQNKKSQKGQKDISEKQAEALKKIEQKIEGDPTNPAVRGIKQMIDDAITTGQTTGSDIKTLEALLKSVGVDTKDAKTLISVLALTTQSTNQSRSAELLRLKTVHPNLSIWKNAQAVDTILNDRDLKPVTVQDINDLLELVKLLHNTPEEQAIFGTPDPTASKYWKFKIQYLPKKEKTMQDLQAVKSKVSGKKQDLDDRKRDRKILEDAITNVKADYATKMKDVKGARMAEENKIANVNQSSLSEMKIYVNKLETGKEKNEYVTLQNKYAKTPQQNILDEANEVLKSLNKYKNRYAKKIASSVDDIKAVDENGKMRIEHRGYYYTYAQWIDSIKKTIKNAEKSKKIFGFDPKPFDDEIVKLTKEEQAFLTNPAHDLKQFDPVMNALLGDIAPLEADEQKLTQEDQDELQQGFGLRKKRRGKLSKLENMTLDDISKAIYAQMKKKRADKRRNGNNKYHHFQHRENGKFTGGIIDKPEDIEKKIMEIVGTGNVLQAVRMLEASRDVFSKSQYDNVMQKVLRVY